MHNDHNPQFLRQFYAALRTICQEFFLGRSKNSGPVSAATNPIEAVFDQRNAKSYLDRANVMEELMETRVSVTGEFASTAVLTRIEEALSAVATGKAANVFASHATPTSQFVQEKIRALSEQPMSEAATPLMAVPDIPVIDTLMKEFVALAKLEKSLHDALAQHKSKKTDKSSIDAIEHELQTCLTRKAAVSARIKAARAQSKVAA